MQQGVGLATRVESPGVDLRTRTMQVGATCDVRFFGARRNRALQKNYVRIGVGKLLRMGLVFARRWREQAVDISATEFKS